MRYASKDELLSDIRDEHDTLGAMIEAIPDARWSEPGVWGDGWTLTDLIAHLAAWHGLFIGWYEAGLRGENPELPAPGYKWNEIRRLNRDLYERCRGQSRPGVRADFETGYARIMAIVESLSDDQIIKPGAFFWTGKNGLKTYLGANTASHYRFAMKVIRRWMKKP